ncbi:predicted protein [Chaetomium globosum CBS 148.51]|uniref:Uncharacterized protein n=1 Tax=Chaetomium globosum (strain ATCC 6205 / CBS 148.51 / DSM 1962 / NBRC 6347 / NRRL 1970) TaxID=306901 RepID=Q2GQR1_CHAGB|nr:uncharacterized protein CHGG_09693 [Chaetomium globosum CBS 148.51]EAQ83289.1 predicted protein [Chaetomium globosum CBS 148.51]
MARALTPQSLNYKTVTSSPSSCHVLVGFCHGKSTNPSHGTHSDTVQSAAVAANALHRSMPNAAFQKCIIAFPAWNHFPL